MKSSCWIENNESPLVVIFVHGILSSGETCWKNPSNGAYWPDLIRSDPEFHHPAVFVASYTASLRAGSFDVYDAAEELYARLKETYASQAPIQRPDLLFVCHSQGGIVVRQMLVQQQAALRDKRIGLVLCGSPGWGSFFATLLLPFSSLLGFRQASDLAWGATGLVRLDRQFSDLMKNKVYKNLVGISLVETKGRWGFPKVVSGASATRYFPDWKQIPEADHSAIVKPDDTRHLSHIYLKEFAQSAGLFISIEPELLNRLCAIKDRCRELNGEFRVPNLIEALLSIRGGMANHTLSPTQRLIVQEWVDAYRHKLEHGLARPYTEFSWYDMPPIAYARDIARKQGTLAILERHLWSGVLEAYSGSRLHLIEALGEDEFASLCRKSDPAYRMYMRKPYGYREPQQHE